MPSFSRFKPPSAIHRARPLVITWLLTLGTVLLFGLVSSTSAFTAEKPVSTETNIPSSESEEVVKEGSLGKAEGKDPPPNNMTSVHGILRRYDQGEKFPRNKQNAYCAWFQNSCDVTFDSDKGYIQVDEEPGIYRDQIVGVWANNWGISPFPIVFLEYVGRDGEKRFGRFLFNGYNAADKFYFRLQEFMYGR